MNARRVQRHFVAVMAKHLPPSASTLRLLDLDGRSGGVMTNWRADLEIMSMTPADLGAARLVPDSIDAVVGYDVEVDADLLGESLRLLRPGGRLIMLQSRGPVCESQARTLRENGYTRILVEPALDGLGVLLRGEKPHLTADKGQRIRSIARTDGDLLDLDQYAGRYLHLLIHQLPNKPVWKLRADEPRSWRAAAYDDGAGLAVLAFSSLPKAVSFMQPAVLQGLIRDINKVGKFSRATAMSWQWAVVLNPTPASIRGQSLTTVPIDHASAEAPDE